MQNIIRLKDVLTLTAGVVVSLVVIVLFFNLGVYKYLLFTIDGAKVDATVVRTANIDGVKKSYYVTYEFEDENGNKWYGVGQSGFSSVPSYGEKIKVIYYRKDPLISTNYTINYYALPLICLCLLFALFSPCIKLFIVYRKLKSYGY